MAGWGINETTTTRTTTGGIEYRVDINGFPVETCPRCFGDGDMPGYRGVDGGRCFKCGRGGYVYPRGKAGDLATEFYTTWKNAKTCIPCGHVTVNADGTRTLTVGVQVGQKIRHYGNKKAPFRTVTAAKVTRRVVGEHYESYQLRSLKLETFLTFDDGTTERVWGESWVPQLDRPALVALRDRLAGEARDLYEKTLTRRAARAAR